LPLGRGDPRGIMKHCLVLLVVLCVIAGALGQSNIQKNITASCALGVAPHKSSMVSPVVASFSCDLTEAQVASSGAARVYGGENRSSRVYIGRNSLSPSDPIVALFKGGKQQWCRTDYETTTNQVEGYGLLFSNTVGDKVGELYAVFNNRGYLQGSGAHDLRRFSQEGRETYYGPLAAGNCVSRHPQGAAKASVLAKLDVKTGSVLTSTFLTGERLFGTTSSFLVTDLDSQPATKARSARVLVSAMTSNAPLRTDLTRMICNQGGPYSYKVELTPDLSAALSTTAPGCY